MASPGARRKNLGGALGVGAVVGSAASSMGASTVDLVAYTNGCTVVLLFVIRHLALLSCAGDAGGVIGLEVVRVS